MTTTGHTYPPEIDRQTLSEESAPTQRAFEDSIDRPSVQNIPVARTKEEEPTAQESDAGKERGRTSARPRASSWSGAGIRLFILLLIGALVVLVAREWDWWAGSAILQRTDDAYLRADLTPLAAKVPGYVSRVLVQDFQKVHAGDVLVEIVDDDYRAQLAQAQADVAAAEAAIENIEQQKLLQKALIKQAEADIDVSEADLTRYHLETVRQKALLAHRIAGTPQATEQAVDNEERTAATLALSRAKLEQQSQQLNVLDSQMKQAIASRDAKQAARNLAEINLGYTRIKAPVDGMVSERQVRPGQYVSIGSQVISDVPLPDVWVIANYKEIQMTRIRIGQRAT